MITTYRSARLVSIDPLYRIYYFCNTLENREVLEKKTYVVDIDTSETIHCSLQNETSVVAWYDGNGNELKSGGRITVSSKTLVLSDVQLSDGGTYECRGLTPGTHVTYARFYTIYVNGRLIF